MNKSQLPKLRGHKVRIRPPSIQLDSVTGEPFTARDDIWIVVSATTEELLIRNTYTQHHATIRPDHMIEYVSETKDTGFLMLKIQVLLRSSEVHIEPISPIKNRP